jgi:hypothetical protein
MGIAFSALICISALSASARSSSRSPRAQGCSAVVRPRSATRSAAFESPSRASAPLIRTSNASASPRVAARAYSVRCRSSSLTASRSSLRSPMRYSEYACQ